MLLAFAEHLLLAAAPVMKKGDVLGGVGLVGRDDPVVVLEVFGLEQVELQRPFVARGFSLSDEDAPVGVAPTIRLPLGLEVRPGGVDATPALAALDHFLEHDEALERYGAREQDAMLLKGREDGVIEELKNALSTRDSNWAFGTRSRRRPKHSLMKSGAPLESWTLPER